MPASADSGSATEAPRLDLTLLDPVWKKLTSTVGLLVIANGDDVNVQSVEWTYFVAKDPITVAVVVHEDNWSTELIASSDEFCVTLCSASQAHLADFCGSFSGRDIHKHSSTALALRRSTLVRPPWVEGGVVALECAVTQRIDLPHYVMVLGEVRQVHGAQQSPPPLVKHDRMFELGPELKREHVTVGARESDLGYRVGASSSPQTSTEVRYEVSLRAADGAEIAAGTFPPNEYGDLDVEVPVSSADRARAHTVVASRSGNAPGVAALELGQVPRIYD
jgi:flavin reductase (DIM6/NTAB) family NADH-FMN oxidoreductase RutF